MPNRPGASGETSVNAMNIDTVDVDDFAKENGTNSEKSCDSGIETTETCSKTFPASSDSETSPVKSILKDDIELDPTFENVDSAAQKSAENVSLQSSATLSPILSISPEDNCSSESLCSEASPIITENTKELKLPNNAKHSATNLGIDEIIEINVPEHEQNNLEYSDAISTSTLDDNASQTCIPILTASCESLDGGKSNQNVNDLASSSISLDEKIPTSKMSKLQFSRSAENISVNIENPDLSALSIDNKALDKEEILTQFSLQKKQANATQRIPENTTLPANVDVRYTRIPKEILSQDIGSIVKNVHGMFSSVSGSLKYYTHRTVQKPAKNLKPINGKVMTDIFEDETNEVQKIEQEIERTDSEPIEEIKESETDPKTEFLRLQIESLEQLLFEQRKENTSLRETVKQQVEECQGRDQMFKDLEGKLDLMSKRVEQAEREKDAAVMRYASVECAAIEAKRAADFASRAERAAKAEMELVSGKLKSAHGEKQRIIQLYDDKCHELQDSDRELAKVRDDIKELEGRLKWTQSKLRMEMDAYKESSERAEKLSQQVSELEAAKDAAAVNATDSIKARQFEAELKECRAALILCRHENEELDRRLTTVTQQLDTCRRERDSATSSLAHTTAEVEELKISNLRLEEEAAELALLRAKAALADTLSSQLERETERANQAEEALTAERALAETCARREAAALEHAARLTHSHVSQRASTDCSAAKAEALSADNASLRERVTSLEAECTRLQTALTEETERRNHENRVLARKVAELTEEVAEASKKLEWEKGENGVLKKKHASAIKELNRELQRALKRCEQLEARLPPPDAPSTRTGSVTSLSSAESAPQDERLQNGHADTLPEIQVREPDRQALIERIVSLQRAAARRSERCEFLEEHTKQLTEELRSKSRLLRQLFCTMPAGAVSSPHRDINKKQIASAGGGAMAAVWGGDPSGMTLELSLEMNKRLQAVLEDTLLKNITLKDNMDTLGAEISRLKSQRTDAK